MRRRRTTCPQGAAWAAAGLALCAALGHPARAQDAANVTGAEAWSRIVGNTVSGRTPDGPYLELFSPDGAFTLVDGDGKAGGRWALREGKLCTQAEGEDEEECRDLSVTGQAGAFTDAAGSRYPFEILAGNPKGL